MKGSIYGILIGILFPLLSFCQKGNNSISLNQPEPSGDTIRLDSQRIQSEIKPLTKRVLVERIMMLDSAGQQEEKEFYQFPYLEERAIRENFSQTLGMNGKPYKRYHLGIPAHLGPDSYFKNPITGEEDLYMLNPENEAPFFDSRTPYLQALYSQGSNKLSVIDVTATMNTGPFVNTSLLFRHRKNQGLYQNNEVDQYNISASNYFHTFNQKFHLFSNFTFNELTDEFNGGLRNDYAYDTLFIKNLVGTMLTDARLHKRHKSLSFRPFYRFYTDSSRSKHQPQVGAILLLEDFSHQMGDAQISAANSFQYPVYPSIDSVGYMEKIYFKNLKWGGNFGYSFSDSVIDPSLNVSFTQQHRSYKQDSLTNSEQLSEIVAKARINLKTKKVKSTLGGELSSTISTLLGAGLKTHISFDALFGEEIKDYVEFIDTSDGKWYRFVSHQPFELRADFFLNNAPPSYFQSFYFPSANNSYSPNPNLKNQTVSHLSSEIVYKGRIRAKKNRTYRQRKVGLTLYNTLLSRHIYFGEEMNVTQAISGETINVLGTKISGRVNFKRIYFELDHHFQKSFVSGGNSFRGIFKDNLPFVFGTFKMYYEDHDLSFVKKMRGGIEVNYHSSFDPFMYDPASQQFYSGPAENLGKWYPRFDLFFSVRIKTADLYVRLHHFNQWTFNNPNIAGGYFTTPFYPMRPRTLLFGLNWTFYN